MSNAKIKALINYLKKKKHKDKKYLIEFLDIQVLDDDFL
jgi:ribosomal protein S15P/S13E